MMILIHLAFTLSLLSLTAGTALFVWSLRSQEAGSSFARITGLIVIFLSTLSVVGSFYLGAKIWKDIYLINSMQNASMQKMPEANNAEMSNTLEKHHHHKKSHS
jgi:hypothetical protein